MCSHATVTDSDLLSLIGTYDWDLYFYLLGCSTHQNLMSCSRILNSIKGFKLKQLQWSNITLDCDTLEKYAELMDIIFSVKYIERAFELKIIIDHALLRLHPHMCYPVTWYDVLLYRYYCSPWVTPKDFHLEEGEVLDEGDIITVSSDEAFESD